MASTLAPRQYMARWTDTPTPPTTRPMYCLARSICINEFSRIMSHIKTLSCHRNIYNMAFELLDLQRANSQEESSSGRSGEDAASQHSEQSMSGRQVTAGRGCSGSASRV